MFIVGTGDEIGNSFHFRQGVGDGYSHIRFLQKFQVVGIVADGDESSVPQFRLLPQITQAVAFVGILGDYLENDILPDADLNLDDFKLELNSYLYYIDANGQVQPLQQHSGGRICR